MSMVSLPERIRQLREKHGLLQKEFARRVGVSKPTVSAWEQGTRSPNSTQRKKLCEIFGITEGELFGGQAPEQKISPEILAALKDPIARQALLDIAKHPHDIKFAVKVLLDCLPNLPPEKRHALMALCK